MSVWKTIASYLPEVRPPTQKRLSFGEKLKWTGIVLVLFFALGAVPLFGLGQNALAQFESISVLLGAQIGSIVSLGIGPLVTASIVLQLLNGSGIIKFNLQTPEGKKNFQAIQKVLGLAFVLFESCVFVFAGGLAPDANLATSNPGLYFQIELLLVFQLFLGGLLIMFMDEVSSKWGFGSGLSLFIAAGVSQQVFITAFNFLPSPNNPGIAAGAIPALFQSLARGDPQTAALMFAGVVATIVVFAISVYTQAMKVEIPLSFGRVRGQGIRWPLNFMYTSNIPVILVAALIANVQIFAGILSARGINWLGTFQGSQPVSGFASYLFPPDVVGALIRGSFNMSILGQALVYSAIMIGGCILFSYLWVQTAGMDARSQAKQIMGSGLQVPGFRKDARVMERLLDRYIGPLTFMGAVAVGFLAAIADVSGALTSGTGLLLTVMIIYRMYEDIAKQHMMDMNPAMRKFMQ